jgi:hypothetical protein
MKGQKSVRVFVKNFRRFKFGILAVSLSLSFIFAAAYHQSVHAALTMKTWDGGGMTNNWSEAANWSDDTLPASGDDVVFDGTSTKDVSIDMTITVDSILVNAAYTGTITQSNTSTINVSGCNGRVCFTQNNGTFNGGTAAINLFSSGFGTLTVNGGTFNGGEGDIHLDGDSNSNHNLVLNGGSFKSTSGTLFVARDLRIQGGTFNHNSGTVTFNSDHNVFVTASATDLFNNVNFNKAGTDLFISGRLVVTGNLSLNDGSISINGNTLEARGAVTILPGFDGGNATLELTNGIGTRTVTLSTDLNLPKLVINDPNVTVNTSGSGTLHFPHQLILQQGTFNQGNVDLLIEPINVGGGTCYSQSGGIFNGSSNLITLNGNGFGEITMTGGIFNGGSGDIVGVSTSNQTDNFLVQGGTFKSTSGTLTAPDSLMIQGGTFLNNSGTVVFTDVQSTQVSSGPSDIFNNVVINKPNADLLLGTRMVVAGSLSLQDGSISNNGNIIESRGSLTISPNFDGGNATLELANGSAPRNITFSTDLTLPKLVINDPNVTISTSGSGTLHFPHQLILRQGIFNQGSVDLLIEATSVGGGFCYSQTGGIFNGSAKTVTLPANGFGSILMTGGTFNGGSGDINLVGAPADNPTLSLQGGTFRSTSGILRVPGNFQFQGIGTTFLHNSGTVNFTSGSNVFLTGDSDHPSITFNNLNISLSNGVNLGLGLIVVATGNLNLDDGSIGQAGTIVEADGSVVIGPNFDGGATNFKFGGGADQTFTNNGGANPTGTWTVNKWFGRVTVASNLIFPNLSRLDIFSGNLYLGPGSDLSTPTVTSGPLTIEANGKLLADSNNVITLGDNIVNNGTINLHSNGTGCPTTDSIKLRSSVAGTQRSWSGSGVFRAVNVDVQDMGGTAAIKDFSGTDSGNNDGNWTFDSSCSANSIHTPSDFDGDHKTDVAVFRPTTTEWWFARSTLGLVATQFGSASDKIIPADFDGDGIADMAVWREAAQSTFYIFESSTSTLRTDDFGIVGDDPKLVADWDGDGKADPAVYRPGTGNQSGTIFYRASSNNPNRNITFFQWGSNDDRPVRGDFDGDGKADPAVFKSDGSWWILLSSNGTLSVQFWGLATDKIVYGDFDGDGKTDLAVFRPSDTNWYILQSSNGQPTVRQFGLATDVLTPGDYDGDGKTDLSVFRPSNGETWMLMSTNGTSKTITFGTAGDIPAASASQ